LSRIIQRNEVLPCGAADRGRGDPAGRRLLVVGTGILVGFLRWRGRDHIQRPLDPLGGGAFHAVVGLSTRLVFYGASLKNRLTLMRGFTAVMTIAEPFDATGCGESIE
jgi:hypothetical protein